MPGIYEAFSFQCVDCGTTETWTAKQQKWWYEKAKGDWRSTANRCCQCRRIKRLRKAEVRQRSFEGLVKKQAKLKQLIEDCRNSECLRILTERLRKAEMQRAVLEPLVKKQAKLESYRK